MSQLMGYCLDGAENKVGTRCRWLPGPTQRGVDIHGRATIQIQIAEVKFFRKTGHAGRQAVRIDDDRGKRTRSSATSRN